MPASDYYPAYSRTGADVMKPITPDEALARAVDWKEANPTYCQSDTFPDRHGKQYRPDCSGFVSMAWHISSPLTTATLPGVSKRIPITDIQPGDALINDHHTELVWKVEGTTITTIGFGWTPVDHEIESFTSAETTYDAYRYNNMQVVTDEKVRQWIRDGVPEPKLNLEPPGGQSIVNWDTLFHVNPDGDEDADNTWEETVDVGMGGLQVRLRATATTFHWNFASPDQDGEPSTTPGGVDTPHPGVAFGEDGPQVKHRYMTADTFHPSVVITWSNYQYMIVGEEADGWQDVDGEHTDGSPELELDIRDLSSVITN